MASAKQGKQESEQKMHLNLFGRKRSTEKPAVFRAQHRRPLQKQEEKMNTIDSLARMRETVRDLEKRENFLTVKANAQLEEAMSKSKAGDEKGALTAMTRKKMFDKEGQL